MKAVRMGAVVARLAVIPVLGVLPSAVALPDGEERETAYLVSEIVSVYVLSSLSGGEVDDLEVQAAIPLWPLAQLLGDVVMLAAPQAELSA